MASKTLADLKNKDLLRTKGYINHAWVDATSNATFDVINPATLEKLATLPEMDAKDVDRAVEAAAVAFQSYKKTSARQRARWLRKWSDLCHDNIDDLALIMTLENGKTLTEAKGEVVYAASFLEWFASEAERVHGEVVPTANLGQRIVTIKQPLGVAACLTPWNFPLASMSATAYAIQCII
jgi:succinate-semialdehyde dehydrogenase/glutarate-semialdehyde dehydrogenase